MAPAVEPGRRLGPRPRRRSHHGLLNPWIRHGCPSSLFCHGRPSSLIRHGLPSSLLHRGSRNGHRPGGRLSCLLVPGGLQSAHPPSPLDVARRGTHLSGGGSNSDLCPHVLCFPPSCAHIWLVPVPVPV